LVSAPPLFSIVPIEVVQDKRLTLWHVRVLVALLSFRRKNTDTVWPSREQIAERAGMHIANVSKTTSELVSLGWLVKDGGGGRSKSCEYRITVPETVAESATDSYPQTVAAPATVAEFATVAESTTKTLAESATRIIGEQSNEQSNKRTHARPSDVDAQQWADWVALRRAKRAPVTETALDGIRREAAKAGVTLQAALAECCARGWTGFKADWVQPRITAPPNAADRRAAFVASITGTAGPQQDPRIIDVDFAEPAPARLAIGRR